MADEKEKEDKGTTATLDKKEDDKTDKSEKGKKDDVVDTKSEESLGKLPQAWQDEIRGLRAEAKEKRLKSSAAEKELGDLKAEIKAKEDKAENEKLEAEGKHKELADKLQKELDTLQAQNKAEKLSNALEKAALAAGIRSAAAAALIKSDKIKFTDAGEIKGVDEAVAEFKTGNPELFKEPETQPPPQQQSGVKNTGSSKDVTPGGSTGRTDVMDMTPEEYKEHKKQRLGSGA